MWIAYRLQVFQPRSVDATETTLLVPAPGAPHSDNFDACTIQGVSGSQPYLHLPTGQNGAIDPVAKNTTVGTRIVAILDQRVTPGGSNAVRWATAFLGSAAGRNRLKGCKAIIYEQTAQGGAWNPWFTGRVGNVRLDGLLKLSLEVKSSIDDLNRKRIFLYDPHPSVTYAFRSAIVPPRLTRSWGSGTLPAGAWLSATVANRFVDANGLAHATLVLSTTGEDLKTAAMVTQQSAPFSAGQAPGAVFLKVTSGGATGLFRCPKHLLAYVQTSNKSFVPRRYFLQIGPIEEVPAAHPLHLTLPANGTAVTCYVQGDDRTPVSSRAPLFIDDVHPLVLWGDILDGKFGVIDETTFTARPVAPRDTSGGGPWDYTNPASPSYSMVNLPLIRFPITKSEIGKAWIEAQICQPFNLGYYTDGQGRVVPVDLRPTSASTTAGSITDTDLTELPNDWTVDGSTALLGVNASYYVDLPAQGSAADLWDASEAFPDITPSLVQSFSQPWIVINPLLDVTRDAGDQTASVDAQGVRLTENEFAGGANTLAQLDKLTPLTKAQQDMLAPFSGGSVTVTLSLTRDSAFANSANGVPGKFWTITVSSLPDPTTNQRGGPRVGLCLSRTEQGLRVIASFLDVGSASAAAVPTVGTLAISNGALEVPITINAASDPVQVEYIVTAAGTGSRPADNDPTWRLLGNILQHGLLTASGSARQDGLPANTRLWVRARSRPMGNGLKLPSAFVYPATGSPAGSIDVPAITAPSAVSVSSITGNRALVSWTVGDATQPVELYLHAGGVPGAWTEDMKQTPVLLAGSTQQRLTDLTPSTTYGVGIRHRDTLGGGSAFATATFTTTGTASTAPAPPAPGIGGGASSGSGTGLTPTQPRRGTPIGVMLNLFPIDPAFSFEIQHAPDSSGAPNVGAAASVATNVPGTQRSYHDQQPIDGATHWYRVRHVGFSDTASSWSDWVSATSIVQRPEGPNSSIANSLNAQSRWRCSLSNSGIQGIANNTVTAATFDTEAYDIGNLHSTSTNPSRITIPTGGGGRLWLFTMIASWANNVDTTQRLVSLYKKGALLADGPRVAAVNGGTTNQSFTWSDIPADGDWYEMKVWQNSGAAVNLGAGTLFSAIDVW